MTEKVRLVLCRKCNTPFAKTEKRCPECGKKQGNFFTRWAWIPTLVLLVAAFFYFGGRIMDERRAQEALENHQKALAEWQVYPLGGQLPHPPTYDYNFWTNTSERMHVSMDDISAENYKAYLDKCKELGFTVESEDTWDSYTAYNHEGYKLHMTHWSSGYLSIELDAPIQLETLTWPTSAPAKLLPKPESTVGKLDWEKANSFNLYVGEMPIEKYNDYVQSCIQKGFSIDYSKGKDYYRADHPAGYSLSLTYEGADIVRIHMSEIEEESPAEETVSVKPTATPKITTVPKPVTPEKTAVSSKTTYDFALVKSGSSYDQYYLLDYDSKTAVYFCTNGDSVLEGKMTGTMRPKLVITYHAGGDTWSESMKYKSGSSTVVVMTDHNGFDWEFEVTDVATAVQYLPGVEASSTDWVHWTAFPQATSTPKSTATPKPTQKLVNGMRPEFKAAMDEYEEFFDDYVELMKKLEKNPDDPMLLLKSAKFMVQYAETMEALEAWEDDDLNSKELNYYITVTNRINKKLLEVAK